MNFKTVQMFVMSSIVTGSGRNDFGLEKRIRELDILLPK